MNSSLQDYSRLALYTLATAPHVPLFWWVWKPVKHAHSFTLRNFLICTGTTNAQHMPEIKVVVHIFAVMCWGAPNQGPIPAHVHF